MPKVMCGTTRRGITLLEVLISIGILAIGLMGTLALIPAGGSYLRKSQIESGAAVLIQNALSTMQSSRLFNENSIDWLENNSVYREQEGRLWGYPNYPSNTSEESIDGAQITHWYDVRDDAPKIRGTVDTNDLSEVTVTATGPGGKTVTHPPIQPDNNGNWVTAWQPQDLWLSDPPVADEERMTIVGTGSTPDEPDVYFDEWSFEVDRGQITKAEPPLMPLRESGSTDPSAYRYYRLRRRQDFLYGDARLDFTLPSYRSNRHATNNTLNDSDLIRVPLGYDRVTTQIQGWLWRYEVGRRLGQYRRYRRFRDFFQDGPVQPSYQSWLYSPDQGSAWLDSGYSVKDPNEPDGILGDTVDFYQIPSLQNQQVAISWAGTNTDVRNKSLSDRYKDEDDQEHPDPFSIQFDGQPITPQVSTATSATYMAPSDGYFQVETRLLDVVGDASDGHRLNHWSGSPLRYTLDVTVFGNSRIAVIDPLMCSQLEYVAFVWATENGQAIASHPLYRNIGTAGQFTQNTSVDGLTPTFNMRRLNWKIVSNQATAAQKLAVASNLCRPADVVSVEVQNDELVASQSRYELGEVSACHKAPVYVRYTDGFKYCQECNRQCDVEEFPLARQSEDRLSWMLTIQPEGNGSIQTNWQAGNYFDVATVVFHNRLLPPVGSTVLEGENGFDSWWDNDTGVIKLAVDRTTGIDQDDIRKMFAAGNWVMVAPKLANLNQKVDWLQIQTAELIREPTRTLVEIIPTQEPFTNTSAGSAIFGIDQPNLVTLVYQGVVAVSRRSVQITE